MGVRKGGTGGRGGAEYPRPASFSAISYLSSNLQEMDNPKVSVFHRHIPPRRLNAQGRDW